MIAKPLLASALIVLLGSGSSHLGAQATGPEALIARAVRAMGGVAALDSLRAKRVEFNLVAFGLGQEETYLSQPRTTLSYGSTLTDYAGVRQITSQDVRQVGGAVTRQRRVILPTMSMLEQNGALTMDGAGVSAGLPRAQSLQIERIMLAAAHHGSSALVLPTRTMLGEVADGIRLPLGPDTVNLFFGRSTGLPMASETIADDPVLGDRRTITWYGRWQDAGGLSLPRQIDVEVNGRFQSQTVLTSVVLNPELDAAQFAVPDSMAARAPRPAATPPPLTVLLVNLGPGVWRAEGGSHHSLVVEQGNTLLVIEGPQSAARTSAVLDTLKSRFPSKPVYGVVMTHHHYDHSGGIRAYMARGVRVIAHQRNARFVAGIAAAGKTVAPDRLSRSPGAPPMVPVQDSLALGTGAGKVVLYPLASTHAGGLLAAWLPGAGVVFTSDVVSPSATAPPPRLGSAELVAFARALGIAPARYVGGHGVVIDWSALEAAAR
jgi:glyoxylase-like metal-dependent hydrolase (beta-lactamase superfamily II)